MKFSLHLLVAASIAVVVAGLWVSPWLPVVWFAAIAGYYGWTARHQAQAARALLRDPAAIDVAFDDTVARLRQQLRDAQDLARVRDAEIEQRKQITNAVPDGLFLLDPDDRILWCNRSALTLHALDAFRDVGKPIGQLIRSPDFLAYLRAPNERAPVITVGTRAVLVHVESTVDGARLLVTRDITERERLDRMRRDFVANVSHEMRTPLTVVGGYVETLRDLPVEPDDQKRYFALIAGQTENMRRLVEDLLTLARLENDQVPVDAAPVSLHTIAAEALADAKALSNGRHPLDCELGEVTFNGSGAELRSAISNLLSNAVRYTPDGGRIALSVRTDGEDAIIEITDAGVGIAREHIPRLTERFYRVDRSRSRETGGTGLGLAIVKHVAQRHRGTLEIESDAGVGSTFRLRLPLT